MATGQEILHLKLMSYKNKGKTYVRAYRNKWIAPMRILICVNGVLKHVNTPDSYLRERCANIVDSVRSLA